MLSFDFGRLSALGLNAALASAAWAEIGSVEHDKDASLMRVTAVHRDAVVVDDGSCASRARIAARVARALAEDDDAIAVGDWVAVGDDGHGGAWVVARVPPLSRIARRDADGRRHVVVSNVDTALLVMGLDEDFNPRRLERYVAMAGRDVEPMVVLTKRDLVRDDATLRAKLDALRGRVPPHVEIVAVDGTQPSAADALAHRCGAGQTLVMLGSSGAGKSTLTNTLLGAHVQDTGAVREADGRGQHTTTARTLHRLPGGACIIDTPGLRALRPDADEEALAASFADIATLAARCRFRDCGHEAEPGCAVREHVDADRLRNWRKLQREIRRDTMTVLERREQLAQWKVRGRAVRQKMRVKRGEAP